MPVIQREEDGNGPQQDRTNLRHSPTVSAIGDGAVHTASQGSFHSAVDRPHDSEIEEIPPPALRGQSDFIDLTGAEDQVVPYWHRKKRRQRDLR
jgi:hypothetical protein